MLVARNQDINLDDQATFCAEGRVAGYLFPKFTHRLVQGAMKRACISARLRARSPHDLRHTYATLLLND